MLQVVYSILEVFIIGRDAPSWDVSAPVSAVGRGRGVHTRKPPSRSAPARARRGEGTASAGAEAVEFFFNNKPYLVVVNRSGGKLTLINTSS